MKRSPMKRSTRPLARKARVAQVNRKRHAREWARAYGSKERVAWIARHPSVVSDQTPCENAHVVSGGKGRKADADKVVPLTSAEHRQLHLFGVRQFEVDYDIDLLFTAAQIEREWQQHRAFLESDAW